MLKKSFTIESWEWWIAKSWVLHRSSWGLSPWFYYNWFQVKTLIEKFITLQRRNRWIVRKKVFWDHHRGRSGLDLWLRRSYLGVNRFIWQKTYYAKLSLMDWRELSILRPSPRYFRPWSVISLHESKPRLMECRELSFRRLSLREFKAWSVIFSQLF